MHKYEDCLIISHPKCQIFRQSCIYLGFKLLSELALSEHQFLRLFSNPDDIHSAGIYGNLVAAHLQADSPCTACKVADDCALLSGTLDDDILTLGKNPDIHHHFIQGSGVGGSIPFLLRGLVRRFLYTTPGDACTSSSGEVESVEEFPLLI